MGGPNGPYRQMERLDIYKKYTDKLLAEGKAYYCYCTPEELEAEREALTAQGKMPRYMGKCRNLTPEQRAAYEAEGRKPTIGSGYRKMKTSWSMMKSAGMCISIPTASGTLSS